MSWSHWRLWLLEKDAILWMAKGRPAKSSPSKIPTKWQHFWYSGFPNPDKWWFLWFSPQISKKTPEFSANENSWRKRRPCFVLMKRAYFSSPGKPRCSLAPPSAGPQTFLVHDRKKNNSHFSTFGNRSGLRSGVLLGATPRGGLMENGWGSFDVLKWKELLKKTAASLQCIIFLSKKCELMRIFWHPLFFISKTFVVFGDSDSEVFSFGSFCNAPKALAFRFPFRPWLKSTRKMTEEFAERSQALVVLLFSTLTFPKGSKGCEG